MEKINENIENKYSQFLELLKTNPEAIGNQIVKNKYRELLELYINKSGDDDILLKDVIIHLFELKILDKKEIENIYKNLFNTVFEKSKRDSFLAGHIIPSLINMKILDESEIKDKYKELLEISFVNAFSDDNWTYDDAWVKKVIPALLNLELLNKSDKEQYIKLLDMAFEQAKLDSDWAKIVLELLKLNILEKREIKEHYEELLESAFKSAPIDKSWAKIVGELLNLNILEKREIKERYNELLEMSFEHAKSYSDWAGDVVPELLNLKILDENDKERCKKLLGEAFEQVKSDGSWAKGVIPSLLNLKILDESDKKRYKELLREAFEQAESGSLYWATGVIPALLNLKILDKSDKERYIKLLDVAFEQAKSDGSWATGVIPALLNLKILDKSKIKDRYKDLLEISFKQAKSDFYCTTGVLPALLDLKILDENKIKDKYKKLLELVFNEVLDGNRTYIINGTGVIMFLLSKLSNLKILDKSDKEWYIKLLNISFEQAKSDNNWKYIFGEMLNLKILDKNDKNLYKDLLEISFEQARTDRNWAGGIIPPLLKLKILDENNGNIDILNNITFKGMSFFEKNKDRLNEEDIKFIDKIDDFFSKKEIDYLYEQDYEYFKEIETAVKENDYKKIWELKKECYTDDEKRSIRIIEHYVGKGIWVYFVDKVPSDKKLKNRFRDPHNALLHTTLIIGLAEDLNDKGFSKPDFIKNYLGVAGDRNNGYQQLNDFLEKYKSDRKELVEEAMNTEFKGNREFMNLAEGILEQEKTGELYKNLDNLEQILTLLHMIMNKDALIKLQKLANSDNPDDKKLYEYYKGAIYHPRTKPIIMEMYEDPGEFLGLDDTTFRDLERIHQAKKPSNMVENFEYLDFDARDLVNCLPLGVYDRLSYFKPFEMKFFISGSEVFTKEEIQQKVSEFLLGADQKKISVIITKLKEQGDETMWYQIWKENKGKFIDELTTKYILTDLIDMFVGLGYSEFNKYKDLREMTAKISPKSDPNNWFNGFNCDSLAEGHGKKVVAMFNPYCTDFCIYEGDQDPKEDNLKVTSWVTLNRAIPENFTKLLDKVKSETTHDIVNVLGDKFEDYRDPSEYVITMDNIEANPNFGSKNELAVRKMYEKFFSEYVRQNPISPNGIPINTSKFYSGVNYNKLDILTDKVPNESLPVFVNAYSDNSASYSLKGDLDAGEQKEKQKKTGIHPLSIEDVVQISYMEGKIYPSSMKDHLGNLQHEITASILNNTLKDRPNLSFAWYNEEGKIGGYILAYQGKMEDGTPGVYISDFAIDEKERGTAGIKMIHHWIQEVKKNYPDMPIFTRARENTSYRMVKAFADRQGYEITKDELMQDGGENFHRVVMNPKK